MSDFFDETVMRQTLERYIPEGETLLAGIHAVSNETKIRAVFGKCIRTEVGLIPSEKGHSIVVDKKKSTPYDIFIGITQYSLIIAECEENSYHYQFDDESETEGPALKAELLMEDIGTCYALTDIQSCEMKKALMGAVKCFVTMKDGSTFKLLLPKRGGLGGGMPHYTEYFNAIIARLNKIAS